MSRRILKGKVVTLKKDKTVSVLVERMYLHPRYKKNIKRSKKYLVHNDAHSYSIGDDIMIRENRPISKRKKWVSV